MSLSGAQRYNFEELREQINNEFLNKKMPERLYKSTDGIMSVINAIVKTKGQGWAAQVLNNEGNPLLTKEEQIQFTEAFQPYLESIIDYFTLDKDEMLGGQLGLSSDLTNSVEEINSKSMPGPDDIYIKIINIFKIISSKINKYSSQYGILKLEKEHDLEEDIRLIPKPLQIAISSAVFGLAEIPPEITQEFLNQIKLPFRFIISTIYLLLDIARISIGVVGPSIGRKILSILLSVLELLRGNWKKAILTFIGYYGMVPMLIGELLKIFITLFEMLAPQIQQNIIFGSLDATKSIIIGLLLSIFQITAPEEIRLPIIRVLDKIAQHKEEMDRTLESIGLSPRPNYLSPSWEDLNNIQAVMSDKDYICSCEFQDSVKILNTSAIIRIVLQLLRIPVTQNMIEYTCGNEPCKDFVTTVVKSAKDRTEQEQHMQNPNDLNLRPTGGRILHSRLKKVMP